MVCRRGRPQRGGHATAQTGGELLELLVRYHRDAKLGGGAINVPADPSSAVWDGERFDTRVLGAEPVGVDDEAAPS